MDSFPMQRSFIVWEKVQIKYRDYDGKSSLCVKNLLKIAIYKMSQLYYVVVVHQNKQVQLA